MSNYIYSSVLLLCTSVGLYHRGALSGSIRFILWLIYLTCIVESIGLYNLKILSSHVDWLYDLFVPIEFTLIALYFRDVVIDSTQKQLILFGMFTIYGIYLAGFKLRHVTPLWFTVLFLSAAFCLCIFSFFSLKKLLDIHYEDNLLNNPDFWIATGILFFYGGAFFQMGFYQYMLKQDKEIAQQLYMIINHMLNIIMYSLFTYSFICKAKYQRL